MAMYPEHGHVEGVLTSSHSRTFFLSPLELSAFLSSRPLIPRVILSHCRPLVLFALSSSRPFEFSDSWILNVLSLSDSRPLFRPLVLSDSRRSMHCRPLILPMETEAFKSHPNHPRDPKMPSSGKSSAPFSSL